MFSAHKTSGSYFTGDYLDSYDEFLIDYGNSFDPTTGTFRAPKAGVYEFSAATYHDASESRNDISVEKNGQTELVFHSFTAGTTDMTTDTDTLSFDWAMVLQPGDLVQLKVIGGAFRCQSYAGCTFNGKFIRKE